MDKEISVIVPVYNVDQYLRVCLDSLYNQVDDAMEVILVNDGSTDTSSSILEDYIRLYPATILINRPLAAFQMLVMKG